MEGDGGGEEGEGVGRGGGKGGRVGWGAVKRASAAALRWMRV